jgi:hypothetical protein
MDFYLSIISQAARLIWRRKSLWIFGILTGCGSTNASISGISWLSSRSWYQLINRLLFSSDPFLNDVLGEAETTVVSFLLTVIPLLMIAMIPLSILGQIGIIWGTKTTYTRQNITYQEVYKNSKLFIWRILLINIPIIIGMGTGFGYVSIMMLTPYMILCLLPWFFVVLPSLWFIRVIFEITVVTLVIEDLDIILAFKRGWQTIKIATKDILVMGFILSLSDGVASLLIGLPISLLVYSSASGDLLFQWFLLSLIAYIPLAILMASFTQATIQSSWALTYLGVKHQ